MQAAKSATVADRGPGRPGEFDIDEAVADAIEVSRAHGYHGASVQALTEARGGGLARDSLYKAFHDKRTLFLAAPDHYSTGSLRRIRGTFAQPGPARVAIREALMGCARRAAAGNVEMIAGSLTNDEVDTDNEVCA
jgi:AcrR family transcriptional regulator